MMHANVLLTRTPLERAQTNRKCRGEGLEPHIPVDQRRLGKHEGPQRASHSPVATNCWYPDADNCTAARARNS
eukprot:1159102-Lingulodinium_polyedra.AAC.1